MRNHLSAALTAFLIITASSASSASMAGEACSGYLDRTVSPISFDEAVAPFRGIALKDEFETTLQYEARIAAATFGMGGAVTISRQATKGVPPRYDADAGQLLFKELTLKGVSR